MERFAEAADAIGAESGKLAKIDRLADYLRSLADDDDLVAGRR